MSKVFKTSKGMTLALQPVSQAMCQKCEKVAAANKEKPDEQVASAFLEMCSELFEAGVIKFPLTKYQEAQVTIARPELKKAIPGLRLNLSDFALYILCQVPTYEELTALAVAILETTSKSQPERAKSGLSQLFGRVKPARAKL